MSITFEKVKVAGLQEHYIVWVDKEPVNIIKVERFNNGKIYAYIYNGFPHKYLYMAQGTARNEYLNNTVYSIRGNV